MANEPELTGALEKSLPSSAYVTAESFRSDKANIFDREWFCAGRAEDIPEPGDHLVLDIAGESVIVVRTRAGDIRAHYNVCRHRGARMCDAVSDARWGVKLDAGVVSRSLIRCPYHNWAYSLEGDLIAAPELKDTPDFDKANFKLHPVGVHEWGGFIFVNLTPGEAPDIMDNLGLAAARMSNYPLADLKTTDTLSYDVAANWKLIVENYNECYHCPAVHPELCELVPAFREKGGMAVDWSRGVPHREGAVTYSPTGTSKRAPFPGLDEDEKTRHKGELIYPNLMLSLSCEHAAAFILWPMAENRTRIECRFLFHPDEVAKPDFDSSDVTGFWDMVNRQDWAVCERVQSGMQARVHDYGYYSPMEDLSLDIRRYIGDRQRK